MNLRSYSAFLLCFLTGSPLVPQTFNVKPAKVLGSPRLIATQANPLAVDTTSPNWVDGRELYTPSAIALDNSTNPPGVYVTDTTNNRVLGWHNATQLVAGSMADVVVGQPNVFTTSAAGPSTSNPIGLNLPTGIVVDLTGNLYVADSANNRVLRFPKPFSQPAGSVTPDLVLGQSGFQSSTANPNGVSATSLSLGNSSTFPIIAGLVFDKDGNLFVSDSLNNRVLRYPPSVLVAGNNGSPADLAIGQVDLTSNTAQGNRLAKSGLNQPNGLAFDSSGRLYVGDALARILVFQSPLVSGSTAIRIVGVPSQVPGQPPPPPVGLGNLTGVQGLAIAGGNRLVAIDSTSNRALIYETTDNWPPETTSFSPTAILLIGQNTSSGNQPNLGTGKPTAGSLAAPLGAVASATELFIADANNNRVVVYPINGGIPAQGGSRAIGQLGLTTNAINLIEGREFYLTAGSLLRGSVGIDRTSAPPHLYVADPGNNRVLAFKDASTVRAGDVADLVFGQPDPYNSLVNFPAGNAATPSASSLNHPTGVSVDGSGNLFVADAGNGRVLRFPQPFAQQNTSGPAADMVIGQPSFTAQLTNPTAATMATPYGLAFTTDGSLLVSDFSLNRVLYFPQPLTTGMAATKVIGQSNFTSGGPNGSPPSQGGDPARFINPRFIATDPQDRVYVCDTASARVAVFDTAANLPATLPPPSLSITSSLGNPVGIAIAPATLPNAGQIWIADPPNNRLVRFPPYAQLIASPTPNASLPEIQPFSVAFDPFGNLVVGDSANRVAFFAPALAILNGASFASQAVAPGSIVSIFPSPNTNTIGTDTVSFDSLPNPIPLPKVLGDIQVLIDQKPASLFYVSPTQINLVLSNDIPPNATVNVSVVRQSTGQLYGTNDLSITAVAPALFTLAGTGFGQIAAINRDGTVNSASHPLVRGDVIQLFATGQGFVPGAPPEGTPAAGLTPTATQPQVTIGNISVDPANVQYSGLAPGLIGVWQINVLVPSTVTAGNSVPVVVSLNSIPSPPGQATIALR